MTEGDCQLVIDDETLASVRPVGYSKGALSGAIMTAHPHFDVARAKVVNIRRPPGRRRVCLGHRQG
jgi:hypothetical protein